MKFEERQRVGNDIPSVSPRLPVLLLAFGLATSGVALADGLYKYRGENGEWIYSDRSPQQDTPVEVRELQKGEAAPMVTISHRSSNGRFFFTAQNDYYAPVEVILALDHLENLAKPSSDMPLRWVIPARSQFLLLELQFLNPELPANAEYRKIWLLGDPGSKHAPAEPYRAPFSIASDHKVTQAYPMDATHRTPDSYYAVDFQMPIGTGVFAARAGTVFEVASTNFSGGLSAERYLSAANVVRILHNDGSFATYAHLNWNTIRVEPGDEVERGEYIADSGNTGFTSGPHLHFSVIRNKGLRLESVPVVFEGPNDTGVVPVTGADLVAY